MSDDEQQLLYNHQSNNTLQDERVHGVEAINHTFAQEFHKK